MVTIRSLAELRQRGAVNSECVLEFTFYNKHIIRYNIDDDEFLCMDTYFTDIESIAHEHNIPIPTDMGESVTQKDTLFLNMLGVSNASVWCDKWMCRGDYLFDFSKHVMYDDDDHSDALEQMYKVVEQLFILCENLKIDWSKKFK